MDFQNLDSWAKKVATGPNNIPISTSKKSFVSSKQPLSSKLQPSRQRLQNRLPLSTGLPNRDSCTMGVYNRGLRAKDSRNAFPSRSKPSFERKDQKWSRKSMGSKLFVLPSDSLNPSLVCLKENAFFVKWCGTGGTSKYIMDWWKSSFLVLIVVRQMQNDFLFIECVDVTIKKSITKGSPLFF